MWAPEPHQQAGESSAFPYRAAREGEGSLDKWFVWV